MAEDRRIRKTKKAMTEALAELLAQKPLGSISVREISEAADINRGTFYLHYHDVYDMVEKIQNEMFIKFNEIVATHESERKNKKLFPLLTDIFDLLAENSKLAIVLIGKNGDAAFVDKLKSMVKEKCFADIKDILHTKNDKEMNYFYNHTVSGCIGIFNTWLNDGMKESSAEMALFTERLILAASKALD